ncbi:MAG TPA: RDD family protein [Thermoanaerobaculia bacterium]|nr:RDD family protein [Thermoanaerobaculia bacterium]
MTTANEFVERVLARLPDSVPDREQIGLELSSHIAERVARGTLLEDVLRDLGDPTALAESYLSAVPLVSAPSLHRAVAKLVDLAIVLAAVALLATLAAALLPRRLEGGIVLGALFTAILAFSAGTVFAELRFGQTPGKRIFGLRVVRESGAPIGLGQAIVRQLPLVFSVFFVDAFFIFFTEKKQRAFEMLSKSRVVKV